MSVEAAINQTLSAMCDDDRATFQPLLVSSIAPASMLIAIALCVIGIRLRRKREKIRRGDTASIQGLVTRTDLNDMVVQLVSFTDGRWNVKLSDTGATVRVKECNLLRRA